VSPPATRRVEPGDPIGATTILAGVGPARARNLERMGVSSVRDLLFMIPRRIEPWPERTRVARLRSAEAPIGERCVIAGTVSRWSFARMGRQRSLLRVEIEDGSAAIDVLFFNQPWLRTRFQRGDAVELCGRLVDAKGPALVCSRLGAKERPLPAAGSLEATYPAGEGIKGEFLRDLCRAASERFAERLDDPLPRPVRERLDLPQLSSAVRSLHHPESEDAFRRAGRRVALEAILSLQAELRARRRAGLAGRAARIETEDAHAALLARLPFTLTRGQLAALEEIRGDVARGVPMRRLLQGDVGSGKTALGLYACMAAAQAGGQAAFMAPTELLAEQHFLGAQALLERAGVRAVLLSGSLPAAQRRDAEAALEDGSAQVAFGTHALFSAGVRFQRLWLCVVDEQHRFGVEQRRKLLDKGPDVHALLMTATPIPRSLALTTYGDLEVSLLTERPPGRAPIETCWLRVKRTRVLHEALAACLQRGERAFWVVPRIGDAGEGCGPSDDAGGTGAEERFEELSRSPLARHGIELVHGRIPAEERARRIERFRSGEAGLLVATTVIEVGVDVPEATVMVIEAAERLGLAQLHQLRGRVGRSHRPSWCYLLGKASASERFELLETCADGFVIAEADLAARGMGDLVGVRQAGENSEGLFDPERDLELLQAARELLDEHPGLCETYLRVRRDAGA
jgi:ATP-dependent DNA helicase RecG